MLFGRTQGYFWFSSCLHTNFKKCGKINTWHSNSSVWVMKYSKYYPKRHVWNGWPHAWIGSDLVLNVQYSERKRKEEHKSPCPDWNEKSQMVRCFVSLPPSELYLIRFTFFVFNLWDSAFPVKSLLAFILKQGERIGGKETKKKSKDSNHSSNVTTLAKGFCVLWTSTRYA